jgi:hypothetical protein
MRYGVIPPVAGNESRRRRDESETGYALRIDQRPRERNLTAQRPADDVEWRWLGRESRFERSDNASDRERRSGRAEAVPGQVDGMDAMMRRETRRYETPDAGMHRPSVEQHERRTRPEDSTRSCALTAIPLR